MSVPICNHFHVIRANSGKITLFKRAPLFHTLVGPEILSRKTRVLVMVNTEDFVILACIVLTGLKGVTNRWTKGRMP